MLTQFASIFTDVVLPVLLIIGLGAVIQRLFRLHVPTLTKLNIYLLVPVFLFVRVYDSTLGWRDIGLIGLVVLAPMTLVGLCIYAVMRGRRVDGPTISAVIAGSVIINAGNFGIPLAELMYVDGAPLFPGMRELHDGIAVQAVVVIFANLSIWCIGYVLLSAAKGDGLKGLVGYFKLPMLYVVIAGFLLRDTHTTLPIMINKPMHMIADATVPVMLITLAAQLIDRARWPRWRVVVPVMLIKLVALPAVTFGLVWVLGLWPWPGSQLVIAMAAPTAVNTLLIALKLDGESDLAADCVFWTTVGSAVSVTIIIACVRAMAM